MCYDPFYWYEKELDFEYEKRMNGCEDMTNDEYYDYLADLKADYEIQDYESRMGY